MKFCIVMIYHISIHNIYKTALCLAIAKGKVEIIKLLLAHKDINVNIPSV